MALYTVTLNRGLSIPQHMPQGGIHNDRDDALYASRSFLAANAASVGQRSLRFPCPSDVFDLFSGWLLARGTAQYDRELIAEETLVVRYRRT